MNQFDSIKEQTSKRKNVLTALMVVAAILIIPFGVKLIQQQQELKSKAANDSIQFAGDSVKCDTAGKCTTTSKTVQVQLRSPLGPPAKLPQH